MIVRHKKSTIKFLKKNNSKFKKGKIGFSEEKNQIFGEQNQIFGEQNQIFGNFLTFRITQLHRIFRSFASSLNSGQSVAFMMATKLLVNKGRKNDVGATLYSFSKALNL